MISSNSGIDFISLSKVAGNDPAEIMKDPEFASWLREYLSENTITVTFTKKDGTNRVMKCTKQSDMIPTDKQPKGSGSTSTGDAVAVFDLDKQEWRSFIVENVTKVNYEF